MSRVESGSPRRRVGNLPADLTSFVGRRNDIADIKALLSTSRLVSLVGPGGVGKTRLVLRVAADLRRAFSDGVWLVELAEVNDPGLLAQTIADTLGMSVTGGRNAREALARDLVGRRTLVILDNCEHLLDETAALVADLLRGAPQLRFLTTTRQPLRVSGELIHLVSPLDVPDPTVPLAPGAATQYAGMALFVDRAQAVVPSFALTAENEAAVARLCQRLEGIPLAIELAAVSLRVLSVREVTDRLGERLDVLTTGPRTAPQRQQTMEATIEWSHELCTPDEQALWAACSVFAGPFDRMAAEAVCGSDTLPEHGVLGVLAGLVDKSVLTRDEVDEAVRFRMSETLRQYGAARLAERGDADRARQRHLDYYARLVGRAAAESFGGQQEAWLLRLRRDHANIREALDQAMSRPPHSHLGLRLASAAWFYWAACGHVLEGRHWLDRGLFHDTEASVERARALWTNGFVALLQGDRSVAEDFVEEALALAAALDDAETAAYATHVKGVAALVAGDVTLATALLADAAQRYAERGIDTGLAVMLDVHRGLTALFDGDLATARTCVEEARVTCVRHGERWVLSYALLVAGLVEFTADDLPTAAALVAESLAIKRVFHDTLGIAVGLDALAWVAVADGEVERAATLLGAAQRLWDTVGEPVFGSKHFSTLRSRAEEQVARNADPLVRDEGYERGASFELDQAVAFALGEPEPSAADQDRGDPAVGLTRRETQVAELVGRGLSNKEIAATLVISQRTAEGHVQRILTKFGFTSRAQVATWVTEQQRPNGQTIPS